ncbi:probable disease resistance protein At1g59620 [Quercus lobata]|uniref:NB-ARC domain-containing protein n=1 Tax=Quercus lobata TaxID=97700 RepID=A0A7N2LKG1_QUELO|nr:probable disease resistance protein At1g59620 [Quercus lobata]
MAFSISIVISMRFLAFILIVIVPVYLIIRWLGQVKDIFEQVQRDFKILEAIMKDIEEVAESAKKIDEKPNQLRDSQLKPGATVQLSDAERGWFEATKTLVGTVKDCRESYRRLHETKYFLELFYSGFTGFKKIYDLKADLGSCNSLINEQLWKKTKICKSVEQSRSIVRSLKDRPIEEDKSSIYKRAKETVFIEKKFKSLMDKMNPNLVPETQKEIKYSIQLPLHLLSAFLRDLEGHTLESETEKAWVKEAEEVICKLQHQIDRKTTDLLKWLPFLGNWMMAKDLPKSFEKIERLLWLLFSKKYELDFTFIRRVPSKSVDRTQHQKTQAKIDDKEILEVLDKFHKQLSQEQPKVAFRLNELPDYFEKVHELLKDANPVEGMDNSRMAWKGQMKIIVKDAICSLSSSQPQSSKSQKETDPWLKFSAETARLKKALDLLAISIKIFHIELMRETNWVVGLEEDIHEIVSQLTTNSAENFSTLTSVGMEGITNSFENFSTLSIVGMEGIGKTTLAKMVFNNRAIQKHFVYRYWVSLPDITDDKTELLKKLGKEVLPANEKDYSYKVVNEFLKTRKYLLVLDKIPNKETWDTLKEAFLDNGKGSRILLTTRDKSVASHAGLSCKPYHLRLRTNDESRALFGQMVHCMDEPSHPNHETSSELKNLGKKVVRRCGGLPLSILNHGYLLSGKEVTTDDLSRVLEHVNPYQRPWSENLEKNKKDLHPYLSQCLSYFVKFPKDSEISSRRLAALWVAEGLVEVSDNKPLKSVAENYLLELISHNLVQILERKMNGNARTCVLPCTLREIWLREYPSSCLNEQVIYYFYENDVRSCQGFGGSNYSPNISQSYKNPQSMVCFDTREGDKPGEEIGNYLKKGISRGHLLQLKVLDLEQAFKPQLPKNIGKLKQLTYLGLRWTYLESLPESIGNLVNLEILDVKHTYIRILPSSIWKLQKLQNLYLSDFCRSKIDHQPEKKCHQPNRKFLQNLQILRSGFVDEDNPLKDAFNMMTNLQILDLAFQLELSQQKALADSLVELKKLQELTLKSIDEISQPQDLYVDHLSGLKYLSSLSLFGKLNHPSTIINTTALPQSLTDLTLSASGLSDDPMPQLEKLHKLECLTFYSASYTGKSMFCSKGGFPKLQVLKFIMLQELEEWHVEEQAMPTVKKLEFRSCKKLKVPSGLIHLKTLRELKLKMMPLNFTRQVEKRKEQTWEHISVFPVLIIDLQ